MKGVGVMGVFLGQLPPAELARLKAELAETLIAYFCYPRFFDYRTETLRTRPVDRAKRQEVWLYLSSVDFTVWNRFDLMSPDFQYQVERLFIHFVQRNRSFFGEQGRKRMADIRMLISTCATAVVQGLRNHLTGNSQSNPAFGSPRRVSSWSATNSTGHPELTWEQIGQRTHVLQQQIQEARGEIKPAVVQNEARPPAARPPGRPQSQSIPQPTASSGMQSDIEHQATAAHVPVGKAPVQVNGRNVSPSSVARSASPLQNGKNVGTASGPLAPQMDAATASFEMPIPSASAPVMSPGLAIPPSSTSVAKNVRESSSVLTSDADVAIFEQLRHQLVVWLRVEAVRAGIDITNQGPIQLLELLQQQNTCEDTRLQIVSTLLNLINQVIRNGNANLYDYKQALMLHLIHSRP
ncbi:MAG: hypothetical protein ACJ788_16565 [Ktedonobacteraceae bacterium]